MTYSYSPHLYHHGIKGQRWGVRRFQNEDGSVTAKGAQRYYSEYDDNYHREDDPKNKPNAKPNTSTSRLSESYQKSYNITKEQADAEAKKTVSTAKKVAIGVGAAALVGIGAYAAVKYGRGFMDETIKSGKTLQTLSSFGDRMDTGEAFYTAFRDSDKKKYIGGFGRDALSGKNKLKITSQVKDNMKIAGYKNAKKEFDNLMKNNDEFRKLVIDKRLSDGWKSTKFKNVYEEFNSRGLLANNPNDKGYSDYQKMQKIFYDSLKKKGYSGVKDVNDTLRSGFNTKAAIMFDRSKMGAKQVTALTDKEIRNGEKYFNRAIATSQTLSALATPENIAVGSAYVGAASLYAYSSSKDKELSKKYGRKSQ